MQSDQILLDDVIYQITLHNTKITGYIINSNMGKIKGSEIGALILEGLDIRPEL